MTQLNSSTVADLLPEFKRWSQLEKDSTASTAQKQIYLLQLVLRRYETFSPENCRDFILERKQTKEASTVEKDVHALRVLCDFLVWRGIFKVNWAKELPIPKREIKVPTILTLSEVEQIIKCDLPSSYLVYPDPLKAKQTFDTIFSLLAKTGSRLGEVLKIKIGDISWGEAIWTLQHSKNGRGRLIPIPPDLMPVLTRLAGSRDPLETLFVNNKTGKSMRHHQVEANFRKRLKKCQIRKPAVVHTFRHSFITELLRQDVSVLKIANIVGHENISVTQGYAKLLYEDLRDAILRHPLTARDRNPYDILKHIKETVEKFHLKDDPRFMVNIEDGNDGIRVSVFVR
jgi:integrase/recombinase XerD